jgi:hypothetical protein
VIETVGPAVWVIVGDTVPAVVGAATADVGAMVGEVVHTVKVDGTRVVGAAVVGVAVAVVGVAVVGVAVGTAVVDIVGTDVGSHVPIVAGTGAIVGCPAPGATVDGTRVVGNAVDSAAGDGDIVVGIEVDGPVVELLGMAAAAEYALNHDDWQHLSRVNCESQHPFPATVHFRLRNRGGQATQNHPIKEKRALT